MITSPLCSWLEQSTVISRIVLALGALDGVDGDDRAARLRDRGGDLAEQPAGWRGSSTRRVSENCALGLSTMSGSGIIGGH